MPGSAPTAASKPPAPVPFPADAKVGYVDMQYVISESKLGKAGLEKIQALPGVLRTSTLVSMGYEEPAEDRDQFSSWS